MMNTSNAAYKGAAGLHGGSVRLLDLSDRRWVGSSTAMAEPLLVERLDLSAFAGAVAEGRLRLSVAWTARAATVADLRWLLTFRDGDGRAISRSLITKSIGEAWTQEHVMEPVTDVGTVAVDVVAGTVRSWCSDSACGSIEFTVGTVYFQKITVDAEVTE